MSRRPRLLLWLVPAILYGLFWIWYTPLGGPLTAAEIEHFAATLEANGSGPERIDKFRRFFAGDDGGHFVMVNVLDMADTPAPMPATGPDASAADLMGHYMEHMYAQLLLRACHPVFVGAAAFDSLDIVGIEGAESWDRAALMRYRSRRDLMDIVLDPVTAERHEYKVAALEKTVAIPVTPQLFLSDLRLVLGLALLALAGVLDALVKRTH